MDSSFRFALFSTFLRKSPLSDGGPRSMMGSLHIPLPCETVPCLDNHLRIVFADFADSRGQWKLPIAERILTRVLTLSLCAKGPGSPCSIVVHRVFVLNRCIYQNKIKTTF